MGQTPLETVSWKKAKWLSYSVSLESENPHTTRQGARAPHKGIGNQVPENLAEECCFAVGREWLHLARKYGDPVSEDISRRDIELSPTRQRGGMPVTVR